MYHRIDPVGCGCTDCIIGYSVPIDLALSADFDRFVLGLVDDASATTEKDFNDYCDRSF